ncbi:MAG: trypsin-like peptidase domain-containing protein [Legionellales bacterium]|nr:trypsin-like peptidase domain-containing protein [Legionellales bacterium]
MRNKFFYFLIFISYCTITHSIPTLNSLSPIVDSTNKSIVNIITHGEIPTLTANSGEEGAINIPSRKFKGYGSGVIIDPKGYIITNAHIVQNAKKIFVALHNNNKILAKIIGLDKATDIAVIKIPPQKIPKIEIGDSDQVKPGDFILAIGNPFHLGISNGSNQTVTFGVISALNRTRIASAAGYYDFIQFDAAVNPGSSGGALIDMQGKLIGITTALLVPTGAPAGNIGVSFAIPIKMAKSIMAQIIKHGSVKRASLGTIVQDFTPELSTAFEIPLQEGALITQIKKNSPAEKVGLKRGDIITTIDNEKILNASQVRNMIAIRRIGSTVKVTAIRDRQPISFDVKITELKQNNPVKYAYLSGLKMQNITEYSPVHDLIQGVRLRKITETSPAYSAGLRPEDIIIEANFIPTRNMKELQNVANNSTKGLLVLVLRQQTTFYTILKKENVVTVK